MIDQQPTVVSLTDAAVGKLQELTKEETNPQIGLRVYVYSGGCSGFRYGMMLEDAPTPDDRILEASGIKVYVDGQSVDLLKENPSPSEEEIRLGLEGNLCRCTGYHNIVKAVQYAAEHGGAGGTHAAPADQVATEGATA